jgi:hypothetical protein
MDRLMGWRSPRFGGRQHDLRAGARAVGLLVVTAIAALLAFSLHLGAAVAVGFLAGLPSLYEDRMTTCCALFWIPR